MFVILPLAQLLGRASDGVLCPVAESTANTPDFGYPRLWSLASDNRLASGGHWRVPFWMKGETWFLSGTKNSLTQKL